MTKRSMPVMTSDEEAEALLDGDLSDLDFAAFRPLDWERQPKTARINLRVPQGLVDVQKAKSKERGVPYQRLVREAVERAV
jgi:predicted DNA binding CopG/RHH family protein